LNQYPSRILLLSGPEGDGKRALITEARKVLAQGQDDSKNNTNFVMINVGALLEAHGKDEYRFLQGFCHEFGYFPALLFFGQISSVFDAVLPGSGKLAKGAEASIVVSKVLGCTIQALHKLQQEQREMGKRSNPPTFIIDGFTDENTQHESKEFFEHLVRWAVYVTETGIAKVVFLGDSTWAEGALTGAIGHRPDFLDVFAVQDAAEETVGQWLAETSPKVVEVLDRRHLQVIGGRNADLLSLVRKVEDGEHPEQVLDDMIQATATSVRLLLAGSLAQDRKFSKAQLWRAISLLAKHREVPQDTFLFSVFRGDETAMKSMLSCGVITQCRGSYAADELQSMKVKAGSPLYQEVFRRMTRDEGLTAVYDLEVAKDDIAREQKKLMEYEDELVRLQEVDDVKHFKDRGFTDPKKVLERQKAFLLELVHEQATKLEKYHTERRRCVGVIKAHEQALAQC